MWVTQEEMLRTLKEVVKECVREVVREELSKPKERVLTVKQTCEMLSISAKTLSRMTKARQIHALEGKRPTYTETEVQRVIQARRRY